jgi:hypothetical protein
VENKTVNKVVIIVAVILLLGVIVSFSSINSKEVEIKPEIKSNDSGNINTSEMNINQTTTNPTKNTFSIPLEKPPFIKD